MEHLERELKAGVLFQSRQAEGDHRHIAVACLLQRFSQEGDIVGCPAAAAGLELHHGHLVGIVLTGIERLHQLADDQDGRVAGVVMDVLEAGLGDLRAGGLQNLNLIPVCTQDTRNHPEVHGKHGGDENGVVLFHLLGKGHIVWIHRSSSRSSNAPKRLLRRMVTAPRLVISSILICV